MPTLRVNDNFGPSDWVRIDQRMIDRFSQSTLDPDPMHVDPQWARSVGPFGVTVAFGFLTMSLLTHLLHSAMRSSPVHDPSAGYFLNYGFDRVRLIAPVKTGSDVRGSFRVSEVRARTRGGAIIGFDAQIEIRGETRPALAGKWLAAWMPPTP